MKVLALASYPIEAACTRYRVSQFIEPLRERGIEVTLRPLLDRRTFSELYRPAAIPRTATKLSTAILRRAGDIFSSRHFDLLFVQREALLVGPPLIEWLAMRVGKCPMVLDLDDATYVSYASPTYGKISKTLKWFTKTDDLIRWSTVVTCGNRTIADYVMAKGKPAVIIPTVVDTDRFRPRETGQRNDVPVIGWVGTHSTYQYLQTVFSALERLARNYKFKLRIVGAGREDIVIPGVDVENLPWRLDREIDDFQSFDIGLYPIVEDEWSAAKSGFKSIQYLSVGIPFVSSPVGVSAEIGEADVTHFVAKTEDDWVSALARLLDDGDLRQRMGNEGRKHAVEHYTLAAQADKLSEVFRSAVT